MSAGPFHLFAWLSIMAKPFTSHPSSWSFSAGGYYHSTACTYLRLKAPHFSPAEATFPHLPTCHPWDAHGLIWPSLQLTLYIYLLSVIQKRLPPCGLFIPSLREMNTCGLCYQYFNFYQYGAWLMIHGFRLSIQ